VNYEVEYVTHKTQIKENLEVVENDRWTKITKENVTEYSEWTKIKTLDYSHYREWVGKLFFLVLSHPGLSRMKDHWMVFTLHTAQSCFSWYGWSYGHPTDNVKVPKKTLSSDPKPCHGLIFSSPNRSLKVNSPKLTKISPIRDWPSTLCIGLSAKFKVTWHKLVQISEIRHDQIEILCRSLRIRGQLPAPIVNGREDSSWKWPDLQLQRARDLDLGLGHTAHCRALPLYLYLHAKFHWNRRNILWTDRRMDGHLRQPKSSTKNLTDCPLNRIVLHWTKVTNIQSLLFE